MSIIIRIDINDGTSYSEYRYNKFDNIPFKYHDNIFMISCSNLNLTTLPFFENLRILYCANNKLTNIPKYPKLEYLNCNNNPITTLPLFPFLIHLECSDTNIYMIQEFNRLKILKCTNSKLEYISSMKNLEYFDCDKNKLKIFDGSFPKLKNLNCSYNLIKKITASTPILNTLYCHNNYINRINSIKSPYLDTLICNNNKIDDICIIPSLRFLKCDHNQLTFLNNFPILVSLNCGNNQIKEIPHINSLAELICDNNQIKEIPNITTINILVCSNNLLTTLPNINTWRNLIYIEYENNLIEYLPLHIKRFIERLETNNNINQLNIYNDDQNIHDTNIQESIRNSIDIIIRDKPELSFEQTIIEVKKSDILHHSVKDIIINICGSTETLSISGILYKELFTNVWSIIRNHSNKNDILEIMNEEITNSYDKCFIGKISRLINCLNGFDSRVIIEMDIKYQIGSIITLIRNKLEDSNEYTIEKHKELVIKELTERNIDKETIDLWVEYIE